MRYDRAPGQGRWEHETVAGRPDRELRTRVVTWPPLRLVRLRCERESVDVVFSTGSHYRKEMKHTRGWNGHSSFVRPSRVFGQRQHRQRAARRTRPRSISSICGVTKRGRRGRDRGSRQQHGGRTALTVICETRHCGETCEHLPVSQGMAGNAVALRGVLHQQFQHW